MHRLTVSLAHMVPPTRRQVEVPSDLTLAGLHEVIQVLFDWDGDHLYEFVVGRRRYADPGYLDACEDDDVPLAEVAGRAGKVIGYTYDLGACWEHRIVVDAVEPARAGARYPRCVTGVGPHPAEYDGDRPRRLDLAALNKQLAKLPPQRKAPASAPARAAATPQVRALAGDARRACLLQDLVRLARWTATGRAVTPTGALRKPEVAGALQALGLPAPPAGFHSARHLPRLDACWRLAGDRASRRSSSLAGHPGPGRAHRTGHRSRRRRPRLPTAAGPAKPDASSPTVSVHHHSGPDPGVLAGTRLPPVRRQAVPAHGPDCERSSAAPARSWHAPGQPQQPDHQVMRRLAITCGPLAVRTRV